MTRWDLTDKIVMYAFNFCLTSEVDDVAYFIVNIMLNKDKLNKSLIKYMIDEINRILDSKILTQEIETKWLNFREWLRDL